MKVISLQNQKEFTIVSGDKWAEEKEIGGVYISDLLSDVIGNSRVGQVWLTIQGHTNIIAVAVLKELSAVILCGNNEFNSGTIHKAAEEEITLIKSSLPIYETALALHRLLEPNK